MNETQKHARDCAACSDRCNTIDTLIESLAEHEDLLCPDPGLLYDYAVYGTGPREKLEYHIAHCESCRADLQTFQAWRHETATADRVKEALPAGFEPKPRTPQRRPLVPYLREVIERVASSLSLSVMTPVATLAAVILLVIAWYPGSEMRPMLAVSSVQWEWAAKAGPWKPGSAIVLVLNGFTETPSQERVDALYKAVQPPPDVVKQARVLGPQAVKPVLDDLADQPPDRLRIGRLLKERLNVARLVYLTVTRNADQFSIAGVLIDTQSGKVRRREGVPAVPRDELLDRLNTLAVSLLQG